MKDYYRILGVSPEAKAAQIRRAFRRLAVRYHPDLCAGDKPAAERRFAEMVKANEVLSDPVARMLYDRQRRRLREESPEDIAGPPVRPLAARVRPW